MDDTTTYDDDTVIIKFSSSEVLFHGSLVAEKFMKLMIVDNLMNFHFESDMHIGGVCCLVALPHHD